MQLHMIKTTHHPKQMTGNLEAARLTFDTKCLEAVAHGWPKLVHNPVVVVCVMHLIAADSYTHACLNIRHTPK